MKTMEIKKIGFASDHAGFEMKEALKAYVSTLFPNVELVDFGAFSESSVDYPDMGHLLGNAIDKGDVDWGIASCGSGQGISMVLNKHKQVRAALVWSEEQARLTRQHNNANVVVIPGRFFSMEEGQKMVEIFFATEFEGGRHQGRIEKI